MTYLPLHLFALCGVFAFVLGAAVGSFANCAALRRGTAESVLRGRSRCPHCEHVLGPLELVPLASWFAQAGKCRHCGSGLSVRYPATEAIGGAAFALIVVADALSGRGLGLHTVQNLIFASILLYASLVDWDSRIIPNGCVVAAALVRVVYIVLAGFVLGLEDGMALVRFSLLGALAIGGGMLVTVLLADRVFGRESMGGGDLKLLAVAGLYFGWRQCLFLIIVACLLGIAGALVAQGKTQAGMQGSASAGNKKDGADTQKATGESGSKGNADASCQEQEPLRARLIPFGPAIAAACVLAMAFGQPLVGWYEGLFYVGNLHIR